MNYSEIPKLVRCSICRKNPLGSHFAVAQLTLKANWKYPTHGNILHGTSGLAIAYVCQNCNRPTNEPGDIKEAVEFIDNNGVVYHEIDWITRTFKN